MPIPDEDRVLLRAHEVEAAGLPDWRMLFDALRTRFDTGSFAASLRLADAIGAAAEEADHHPDLDVRYGHLDVRLLSHDVGGVTHRDLRLARVISALARAEGVTAALEGLQTVELALDVDEVGAVSPFWASVLGLEGAGSHELVDPSGAQHSVWFQRSTEMTQRWHVDVRVPPEQVSARIRAALDAGGTLVSDAHAPRFWVLADARGNKACFTTWQGRD